LYRLVYGCHVLSDLVLISISGEIAVGIVNLTHELATSVVKVNGI
jgi:hypothetical protein